MDSLERFLHKSRRFWVVIRKPIFLFMFSLTLLAFFSQLLFPSHFYSNQELLRSFILDFSPYDKIVFVILQAVQVIIAPISHYTIGILGGFVYGAIDGGLYNWIGRMIGHICAYWIGYKLGHHLLSIFFNNNDIQQFKKFIVGDAKTFFLRVMILLFILFLPGFPDDELSYLVGLAAFPFRYYFFILFFGHIGGSFGLAYIGAGIETKDPIFWLIFLFTLLFSVLLIISAYRLGKYEKNALQNILNDER